MQATEHMHCGPLVCSLACHWQLVLVQTCAVVLPQVMLDWALHQQLLPHANPALQLTAVSVFGERRKPGHLN